MSVISYVLFWYSSGTLKQIREIDPKIAPIFVPILPKGRFRRVFYAVGIS